MNDIWIEFAIRVQAIAQAGLQYGKDKYDLERYRELRNIAAEMPAARTEEPVGKICGLFRNKSGYQPPKVDTRAAVFIGGKILLARENNGTWALPGGWCDVDRSVASNTIKEIKEETGLTVTADRLIAVQDWRKHNVTNYTCGVIKTFMLCSCVGGGFRSNVKTTGTALFGMDGLPEGLASEKCTKAQILMCLDALAHPDTPTLFD